MSAEVIRFVETPVVGVDGAPFVASVCGRPMENGVWEGWIEFVPERGGPVFRSQRETIQSSRGKGLEPRPRRRRIDVPISTGRRPGGAPGRAWLRTTSP